MQTWVVSKNKKTHMNVSNADFNPQITKETWWMGVGIGEHHVSWVDGVGDGHRSSFDPKSRLG